MKRAITSISSTRKNEVERRAVKIGTVDDKGVTIAEGLSGQEAVVLSAGRSSTRAEGRAEAPGRSLNRDWKA